MTARATPQPKATAARPHVYTRSTFCALIKAAEGPQKQNAPAFLTSAYKAPSVTTSGEG
jgi:hypothetical protein